MVNNCTPLSTQALADIKVLLSGKIDKLSESIDKEDDDFIREQYKDYRTRLISALKATSGCFDKR